MEIQKQPLSEALKFVLALIDMQRKTFFGNTLARGWLLHPVQNKIIFEDILWATSIVYETERVLVCTRLEGKALTPIVRLTVLI